MADCEAVSCESDCETIELLDETLTDIDHNGPSDSELSDSPNAKTRKFAGAATYHTEFKSIWWKEFPFISAVPGDPFR